MQIRDWKRVSHDICYTSSYSRRSKFSKMRLDESLTQMRQRPEQSRQRQQRSTWNLEIELNQSSSCRSWTWKKAFLKKLLIGNWLPWRLRDCHRCPRQKLVLQETVRDKIPIWWRRPTYANSGHEKSNSESSTFTWGESQHLTAE